MANFCVICNNGIPIRRQNKKSNTCSNECARQVVKNRYHSLNPQTTLSRTASGAVSEYRTIADLLKRGFEVFRSVEPGASCDLAILKNGNLLTVEVKTVKYSSGGKPYKANLTVKANILALVLIDKIIYTPSLG